MITTPISTIIISHVLVVLSAGLIVFAYFRIRLQLAQAEMQHAQNDAKFWRKHYDDLSQRFKAFTDALTKHDLLPEQPAKPDYGVVSSKVYNISDIISVGNGSVTLKDGAKELPGSWVAPGVFMIDNQSAPLPKKTSNEKLKEEMVKQFRTPKRGSHQYENPADLDDF